MGIIDWMARMPMVQSMSFITDTTRSFLLNTISITALFGISLFHVASSSDLHTSEKLSMHLGNGLE